MDLTRNSRDKNIKLQKKNIFVVAAIIINENNEVFCCQRKSSGDLSLKWEFPGGKIEAGETHKQALYRELKEELDIETKVGAFYTMVEYEYNTFYLTMYCYNVNIISGDIKLLVHNDSMWVKKDKLVDIDWAEADVPIVKKIMNERL